MRNEGYIFIRASTWITWVMVSGQTGGGWVNGWVRRFLKWGGWGRDCLLMGMGGMGAEMVK